MQFLICEHCYEIMKSPYTFQFNGVWHRAHKSCCIPLKRKFEEQERRENGIIPNNSLDFMFNRFNKEG